MAKFEYLLSKEEHARGLQVISIAIALEDKRRTLRAVQQIALLGVVVAIATAIYPYSFGGVFIALGIIVAGGCFMQSLRLRYWYGLSYDPTLADNQVDVGSDGIRNRHGGIEHHWPWEALRRVNDLPEAVVLQSADWQAIILPNRLWSVPADRTTLLRELRERAPDLLPDIGPMMRPKAYLNLVSIGSFAAALSSMPIVFVLATAFWRPLRHFVGHSHLRVNILNATIVTLSLIVTLLVGKAAKFALDKLKAHHPTLASAIGLILIGAFAALLYLVPGSHRCGC